MNTKKVPIDILFHGIRQVPEQEARNMWSTIELRCYRVASLKLVEVSAWMVTAAVSGIEVRLKKLKMVHKKYLIFLKRI